MEAVEDAVAGANAWWPGKDGNDTGKRSHGRITNSDRIRELHDDDKEEEEEEIDDRSKKRARR